MVIELAQENALNILKGLIITFKLLYVDEHENILDELCNTLSYLFLVLSIIFTALLIHNGGSSTTLMTIYLTNIILFFTLLLFSIIRLTLFRKIQNNFKKFKTVYLFIKFSLFCSIVLMISLIISLIYYLYLII